MLTSADLPGDLGDDERLVRRWFICEDAVTASEMAEAVTTLLADRAEHGPMPLHFGSSA